MVKRVCTVATGWTKENLLKLCAALKSSIAHGNRKAAYSTGMKRVDWSQVAFPPFSPEACQQKWTEVLCKVKHI